MPECTNTQFKNALWINSMYVLNRKNPPTSLFLIVFTVYSISYAVRIKNDSHWMLYKAFFRPVQTCSQKLIAQLEYDQTIVQIVLAYAELFFLNNKIADNCQDFSLATRLCCVKIQIKFFVNIHLSIHCTITLIRQTVFFITNFALY